jgi:transposase
LDGPSDRRQSAPGWLLSVQPPKQGVSAIQVITIRPNLAKSVFQFHGVDAGGVMLIRKNLRGSEVLAFVRAHAACLVGLEACTTAHHWTPEISALGHHVRQIAAG